MPFWCARTLWFALINFEWFVRAGHIGLQSQDFLALVVDVAHFGMGVVLGFAASLFDSGVFSEARYC